MTHFPVFTDLSRREVFLCGSGKQIMEKLALLREFSPRLTLFSFPGEIEGVECLSRPPEEKDLDRQPALVVTACDEREDARISALCRTRNIPVNAADRPELCTFFFPSLIRRERLCVAVGTGGASPAAAAELRRLLEAQIPERIDEVLDWLVGLRGGLYAGEPDKTKVRKLLRMIAGQAIREGRPLTEEEISELTNRQELFR